MKLVKSIFMVSSVLILAVMATNSYFTDRVTTQGNQFSAGTWESETNKARICHATAVENNYTNLTLSVQGVLSGHMGHQCGRDIIPPFDYDDPIQHFAGQNWDAEGQAIWENDCIVPPAPVH